MGIKAIIFSVFHSDRSESANMGNTANVAGHLDDWAINYKMADGIYKGTSERSFVVVDTPRTRERVLFIARAYKQESVLIINADQHGELVTPEGDYLLTVGRIRSVPSGVALCREAYTKLDTGGYYVGDAVPHNKNNAYQAGTGTIACAAWDSLIPQPLHDKVTGQALGILQPRATRQALGAGIQSWSRPEEDSRTA